MLKRDDPEKPVVREFCAECGTHLISSPPGMAGMAIIKLGTLDNPNAYGSPQMAVFMVDKQPFHQVPAGMAVFERLPG
ncbi:MAG: glutathione-dependent formaldehyde-activating enzyme [Nevskia sp.]|nr:glutathione-dependent formaldehyde-activating enzyme [Nevskia sp.]